MSNENKSVSLRTALSAMSVTENGALSLTTSQPLLWEENVQGRVGFFFKAVRSLLKDIPQLYNYLSQADAENVRDALVLVFHLRNCRDKGKDTGGKGERDLFRLCVEWYKSHDKGHLLTKNLSQVVRFGRWDDVLICPGGHEFMAQQLLQDWEIVNEYFGNMDALLKGKTVHVDEMKTLPKKPITLAAKWAPSACSKNKKSKGKHLPMIEALNKILRQQNLLLLNRKQIREAEYRRMLSRLREYLAVVERLMCSNRWEELDFSTVPSNAMHLYGKSKIKSGTKRRHDGTEVKQGAFLRHCGSKFQEWKEALKTGKTEDGKVVKVNASQLYPHQLVGEYLAHSKAKDDLIEAQWKVLEENVKSKGKLGGCMFVADVSGSMTAEASPGSAVRCLDVSVALSLLGARCCKGKFENMVITFSSNPNFFEVNQDNLYDVVHAMSKMDWGMSTNLQAVFDLILSRAQRFKLPAEELPTAIVIISDMEFNQGCERNDKTNFEVITEKYAQAGYKRPTLVYWNVRSSSTANQFPVSADENGTILLSGYSSSMMSMLMDEGVQNVNPWKIVRKLIDSETYQDIVV